MSPAVLTGDKIDHANGGCLALSLARRGGQHTVTSGELAPPRRHTAARTPASWAALAARAPAQRPPAGSLGQVERATGANLSDARVRTGSAVDAAARAFGADAFTVGRDIHVASTHYRPGTPAGDRLLAHELTHVVQQGAVDARGAGALGVRPADDTAEHAAHAVASHATVPGGGPRVAPAVQRQVSQKETAGITLDLKELRKIQAGDFWTQKILGLVKASMPLTRFAKDTEERDAVLSAAFSELAKRGTISGTIVCILAIPKRTPSTKELAYRLEFGPPAKGDPRPTLDIAFLAEGPGAVAATPATPSTAPTWPTSWKEGGFPKGGLKGFAKIHVDEGNQLIGFVNAAKAGTSFKHIVVTKTTKPPHTTFLVEGAKDVNGTLTALTVILVDQREPVAGTVPSDYAAHDLMDLEIEKLQAKKTDKLGTIKGLAKVPADHRLAVKFAIMQYFDAGKTRDAEVDAIVPLPDGKRRMLYTFRFEPKTNDVSVEFIGEEGKGTVVLDPAKHQLDVRRVQGFDPTFAKDAANYKKWLGGRYKGVTPSGADAPAMITDTNKQLNASAGSVAWFAKNYAMPVLDKTKGAARLHSVHGLDVGQTAGMKDYKPEELRLVEWALEMVSDAVLAIVRGISLVRQVAKLGKVVTPPAKKGDKPTVTYPADKQTAGESLQSGAERTIALYDRMTLNDRALFIGGAVSGGDPRVAPISAMTVLHEFGHMVGFSGVSSTVVAAFNTKFANVKSKLNTAPMTKYAASKPATEFFPEAFAIYNADPEWMQNNLPDMFAWFDKLAKTGTPP